MNKMEERKQKRTLEERENLKQWMTEKFKQRQEKYMQRRKDLIEREPRPFKSHTSVRISCEVFFKNLFDWLIS